MGEFDNDLLMWRSPEPGLDFGMAKETAEGEIVGDGPWRLRSLKNTLSRLWKRLPKEARETAHVTLTVERGRAVFRVRRGPA